MNKEEIKIITLGDIFRNLETEEQAFEFLKYIKNLQQENQKYKEVINKAIEYIETCNPNVELHSEFLDESYLSNYGAKELLDILKAVR